ncbi:hypothetical protein BDV3_000286 [Batrachochytrium dendrobatidis]|uniref:inosine/xanthosine triphosphatase n=1 Tax=Batrachochytrium dendrobatidis (strain JEL423) TaxID=403673 RepID=A0A177W833_BATDL|nr:inosine/xanthosine triphosphatase [Batrachochytrium dendrobatidis JEL423]
MSASELDTLHPKPIQTQQPVLHIVVGSTNAAKLRAARTACSQIFSTHSVIVEGLSVPSGVAAQPLSDNETIRGAENRAKASLCARPQSDYGIEGGIHQIGDRWFESGWIAVLSNKGEMGLASSGRFELSKKIMSKILTGQELAEVIDELSGLKDVRSNSGAMGLISNGLIQRDDMYVSGVIFAFGPFVSEPYLWDK